MKIKCRRGPYAGKVVEVQENWYGDFRVAKPPEIRYAIYDDPADTLMVNFTYGTYKRGNVRTKRGYPVYEWMGWEGEISGR